MSLKHNYILIACLLIWSIAEAQFQNTFVDPRDKRVYKTIKIGTQTWLAENLAYLPSVSHPNSGTDEEALVKSFYYVPGYYGEQVAEAKAHKNYKLYGVLYNWVAAKSACPPGWHLPSDKEWKTLELYLGMSAKQAENMMFRTEGDVGNKLKSDKVWKSPGKDTYGFSALPAGFRFGSNPGIGDQGNFSYIGSEAFFWTSSIYRDGIAIRRQIVSDNNGIVRFPQMVSQAYSVRCIKD